MEKAQIPATGGISPETRKVVDALKQNIEVITGVRGQKISQLAGDATPAEIASKVNTLLALLQNSSQNSTPVSKQQGAPVGYLPADYFTEIDLSTLSSDKVLGVGQSGYINIATSGAANIPLNVACADGQQYEITCINNGSYPSVAAGSSPHIMWNNGPNTETFQRGYIQVYGTSTLAQSNYAGSDGGFFICLASNPLFSKSTAYIETARKYIDTFSRGYETTNGLRTQHISCYSTDYTTPWTSLGTFVLYSACNMLLRVKRTH